MLVHYTRRKTAFEPFFLHRASEFPG